MTAPFIGPLGRDDHLGLCGYSNKPGEPLCLAEADWHGIFTDEHGEVSGGLACCDQHKPIMDQLVTWTHAHEVPCGLPDAIDEVAVHRCGHCDVPLGPEAPSTLFCTPEHQESFYEARSEALVGYREPTDVPAHVYNQVEQVSLETPVLVEWRNVSYGNRADITYQVFDEAHTWGLLDLAAYREALGQAVTAFARLAEVPPGLLGVDPEPDPRRSALEARRNRNTGPRQSQRAPRRIDPRRSR